MKTDILLFYVNGIEVVEKNVDPSMTLLTYLRNELHLTGSKLGCGEGGCGACTVMVSKYQKESGKVKHFAVNACLAPVVSVHHCAVTTVEGIGSTKTKLHQIQERLARFHGSQCGFCTPGIVMSMYALLRNKQIPTSSDIDTCLQGNLCRCTGYRPIIAAFNTFACPKGDQCCKNPKNGRINTSGTELIDGDLDEWKPYDASQEPIFPPQLAILASKNDSHKTVTFRGQHTSWHQPITLKEILDLKSQYPEARIVTGNTEVGIEMNIKGHQYRHLISPIDVPEMNKMETGETGVCIGAACSLSDVEMFLQKICDKKSQHETQAFKAILDMFTLFAGVQIRNVACLGGNIMTASPISDLNPILLACGAKLTFGSSSVGRRDIIIDETFFTGYRKIKTHMDEVLLSITIPYLNEDEVMAVYKQSKRKEDDIAIVNAAFLVNFQSRTDIVKELSMAFGGMAAVTKVPTKTMEKAAGRSWNEKLLEDVCQWLSDEMMLPFDAPGGMAQYRRSLVTSFFFKFYHEVYTKLVKKNLVQENGVKMSRKIIEPLLAEEAPFSGTQTWQEVPPDQDIHDTIGRPISHLSGFKHATGEAIYIDDIPPYKDELQLALVSSTRAHAKIIGVDTSEALASPGVVCYVDKTDVIGENVVLDFGDVFADGKVTTYCHTIGAIVADTLTNAINASRLVKIEYQDIHPQIITIEEAIEHESFWDIVKLKKGNVTEGFESSQNVLEGEARVGGQEHFYLEPQGCIAIPKLEDDEMEIFASCQDLNTLQTMTSICLGIPRNKVIARTKRAGGGFGGKASRFHKVTNPTVVAARKLGKPVRCVLSRQDDMQITGGRHPFFARYKVGYNNDGRILAVKIDLYNNAGNTKDYSVSVMLNALKHSDNCYSVPNIDATGYVCRANISSNTAFRGFGAPQAMLIVEEWITKVAQNLNIDVEKVRNINLIKKGDRLLNGMIVQDLTSRRCWNECLERSNFYQVRKEIEAYNAKNRWKKRGIACVPSKYGVGFVLRQLNQAGALVLVYTDGSVLLSHGGMEMGQGLHTKMVQVASRELGIPTDYFRISETSTSSVPNASSTGSSYSTDLNGMAVKDACEKIMTRLSPIKESNPELTWTELVSKAYMERISLSATGYYKDPDFECNWDTKTGEISGRLHNYVAYGAAVSQVEIDVLTGHNVVLKTDIVVDAGNSLNPAIDVGQVEGAFTQGYGLMTMEELLYSPKKGNLWTVGPGAYKIPGFSNTPKQFNVHILRSAPNDKAIYASKAIGEPPLFLASSILHAIKSAIKSARADSGLKGSFKLDCPATAESIRLACEDEFTNQAAVAGTDNDADLVPWSTRA